MPTADPSQIIICSKEQTEQGCVEWSEYSLKGHSQSISLYHHDKQSLEQHEQADRGASTFDGRTCSDALSNTHLFVLINILGANEKGSGGGTSRFSTRQS
jgi:hypothetical protein